MRFLWVVSGWGGAEWVAVGAVVAADCIGRRATTARPVTYGLSHAFATALDPAVDPAVLTALDLALDVALLAAALDPALHPRALLGDGDGRDDEADGEKSGRDDVS